MIGFFVPYEDIVKDEELYHKITYGMYVMCGILLCIVVVALIVIV